MISRTLRSFFYVWNHIKVTLLKASFNYVLIDLQNIFKLNAEYYKVDVLCTKEEKNENELNFYSNRQLSFSICH